MDWSKKILDRWKWKMEDVWRLDSMEEWMTKKNIYNVCYLPEMITAHELLITDGAGEVLFSRVRACVPRQFIGTCESLSTARPAARERSFTWNTNKYFNIISRNITIGSYKSNESRLPKKWTTCGGKHRRNYQENWRNGIKESTNQSFGYPKWKKRLIKRHWMSTI